MKTILILVISQLVMLLTISCNDEPTDSLTTTASEEKDIRTAPLFTLLSEEDCGIAFTNSVEEDYFVNIMKYDYLYNGGGVGVGDFDNDGLEDLFFTGNQVDDKLYLNKGELHFEDISTSAGIASHAGWSTGVSIVDINQDGWLDIYVCRSGPLSLEYKNTNVLYINNGDLSFTEKAKEFGLAYTGNSTQASFFDMDRDGDLDMYLLTHPASFGHKVMGSEIKALFDAGKLDQDHLFRNDNGKFVDVSKEAGIFDIGFGLGVSIGDLNADQWPDIYVSNDFDEGDKLYINNKDGTFTQSITKMLRHTANYGMGCDIGDINNDGLPDLVSLDMAFETHERSKRNMASMDVPKFNKRVELGWHYQYMANMLHLNNGNGTYSEIAQAAGVNKTDWSWAALFADYDNDGKQDLFISNGYKRDTKDNDLDKNIDELQQELGKESLSVEEVLGVLPINKVKNYMYSNDGNLHYSRIDNEWGINELVNSNGAAWADLDNDGDLEIILNNMDERAYIYENHSEENKDSNYLQVMVENGEGANATGTKVELRHEGLIYMRELFFERGFQSSVGRKLHFGLGEIENVDSLIIYWPKGESKLLRDVSVNQLLVIKKADGENFSIAKEKTEKPKLFEQANADLKVSYIHKENTFNDFEREVLLPHKMSEFGPHLSSGDMNKDGRIDFFIGGAAGSPAKLFFQMEDGTFLRTKHRALEADAGHEDLGSLIFDYDNDGDNDLYVVSGGNEFDQNSGAYQDRLYNNDGQGVLTRVNSALPRITSSGMRVVSSDIDGDGDLDIIIGGRVKPSNYPLAPQTIVLRNLGDSFENASDEMAPQLSRIGMVSDMKFADMDDDGDEDLIVLGEWMKPILFENREGVLIPNESMPDNTEGWWFSIAVADLDGDGDKDIIAGNLGMNNKFHPSAENPLYVYAADFDNNGTNDIVLAKHEKETLYPVRGKECSSVQMPFISEKFSSFKDYASSDLEAIYGKEKLGEALKLHAKEFRSGVFWNEEGSYKFAALPIEAQLFPVMDIISMDINNDGADDLILTGNMYGAEVETTRYDAGNGLVLINKGDREFTALSTVDSGFNTPGNAKDMEYIEMADGRRLVVISNNNQSLQVYFLNN